MKFFNSQKETQQMHEQDEITNDSCDTESTEELGANIGKYHFEIVLDIIQVHTKREIFRD